MENLVLNIFCSMTLLKKNDKLPRYKKKIDFDDLYILLFIFEPSNLRGKISNVLSYCRT